MRIIVIELLNSVLFYGRSILILARKFFIITNAQLSQDGYKIQYELDNKTRELTSNSPIYLTNLQLGTHKITLQLLDKNGNLAEGIFTKTEREFTILPEKK